MVLWCCCVGGVFYHVEQRCAPLFTCRRHRGSRRKNLLAPHGRNMKRTRARGRVMSSASSLYYGCVHACLLACFCLFVVLSTLCGVLLALPHTAHHVCVCVCRFFCTFVHIRSRSLSQTTTTTTTTTLIIMMLMTHTTVIFTTLYVYVYYYI
jgi:hypothetical protein